MVTKAALALCQRARNFSLVVLFHRSRIHTARQQLGPHGLALLAAREQAALLSSN